MVAIAIFAKDFVVQVGRAVDDQVMFNEILGRIDAAEQLENFQAVQRSVRIVDGLQNLDGTFAGGGIAFFDGQILAQLAFDVAGVRRCLERRQKPACFVIVPTLNIPTRDLMALVPVRHQTEACVPDKET